MGVDRLFSLRQSAILLSIVLAVKYFSTEAAASLVLSPSAHILCQRLLCTQRGGVSIVHAKGGGQRSCE